MSISKVVDAIDLHKESFLKACQYIAIFLAWFQQKKSKKQFDFYFSIYMKIFHSRKLFRLFKALFYIPQIKEIIQQIKEGFTYTKLFELLSKIFTSIFYVLDNITIISMILNFAYYKTVRRISHALLFNGILFSTIAVLIQLRQSFQNESDLKETLEVITPSDVLKKLQKIDEKRINIAIKLLKAVGDLFPTLARTNLPEIIFRTKINKGTVGFFGFLSALMKIILKNGHKSKQKTNDH